MSKISVQVIQTQTGAPAVDHIVNTVHFDDFNVPGAESNWQLFADDVRDKFRFRNGQPAGWTVETRVYDMADAKPRPVKAFGAPMATTGTGAAGPREVALCLSYFSERNLPRFRGRLYIGPYRADFMGERPTTVMRDGLVTLAGQLAAIGGVDVDWGLWSPTRNAFSKITAGWVDDEWDTIRKRGRKPTTRTTFTTSE